MSSKKSTSLFNKVGRSRNGYDPDEVDEFFEEARHIYEGTSGGRLTSSDIRQTTFELMHGGYDPREVDAALDRLESAFVARQRAEFIAAQGQQSWMTSLADRARTLYGRLGRPDGEKFAPGERGKPAYDRDDVDDLCDRLVDYFDSQVPISAAEIREATFRRRKGSRGYAEGPVDAFFARAIEVLLGVE